VFDWFNRREIARQSEWSVILKMQMSVSFSCYLGRGGCGDVVKVIS
jgi:uncharacterized membrane protein YbaN (DUF454 family)